MLQLEGLHLVFGVVPRALVTAAVLEVDIRCPFYVLIGAPVAENAEGGGRNLIEGGPRHDRDAQRRRFDSLVCLADEGPDPSTIALVFDEILYSDVGTWIIKGAVALDHLLNGHGMEHENQRVQWLAPPHIQSPDLFLQELEEREQACPTRRVVNLPRKAATNVQSLETGHESDDALNGIHVA